MLTIHEKTKKSLQELYETIVFPLSELKYAHSLDALALSLNDEKIIDDLNLEKDVKEALIAEVKRRLTPPQLKIQYEIEVKCYSFNGIKAIKDALDAGKKLSKSRFEIKFMIIGSPLYLGLLSCTDKTEGLKLMELALKEVERVIVENGGTFKMKSGPIITGEG